MKRKNIAAMVTSIALVGAVAVGGTLALLTQESKTLTNTFTVGAGYANNAFNLYEHGVDQITTDEEATEGYKVGDYAKDTSDVKNANTLNGDIANTYGNVIPGATLDKDPWFKLEGDAPTSWVVARVSKAELFALKQKGIKVSAVETDTKWHVVDGTDNTTWDYGDAVEDTTFNVANGDGYLYFVYAEALDNGESTQPLFTKLKAENSVTATTEALDLNIQGVAVQKLGTDDTPEAAIKAIMTDATGVLG